MNFSDIQSEVSRPFLTWQNIIDWAQTHYRDRIFKKDERIPARPELLYLVSKGAVRLIGTATTQNSEIEEPPESSEQDADSGEAFLGFVDSGQPFEIVAQSSFVCKLMPM